MRDEKRARTISQQVAGYLCTGSDNAGCTETSCGGCEEQFIVGALKMAKKGLERIAYCSKR